MVDETAHLRLGLESKSKDDRRRKDLMNKYQGVGQRKCKCLVFTSHKELHNFGQGTGVYWKTAGVSETQIKTTLFPWEVE
ncbi:hypothetical protein CapIbe_019848 [Capra ibex]